MPGMMKLLANFNDIIKCNTSTNTCITVSISYMYKYDNSTDKNV